MARRAWSGAVAGLLTVALLGVAAAGVGTAAASSLPGDSFYGVKELGRSAQVLFAFDPVRRAELNLKIADQRLGEMEALADSGRNVPRDLVERWLDSQSRALLDIERLPAGQRELLAEMLLASVGRGRSLAGISADAMARMIAGSAELAGRAQEAVGSTPEPPQVATHAPAGGLPAEKEMARRAVKDRAATEAPAQAEVAAPAMEPGPQGVSAPPAPPAPQVAQPGDERDDREDQRPSGHRDDPRPAAPGAEPTQPATEPPPGFNQPIFEEPTDTPEPWPTVGAGATQVPDLPVEPITADP
jgi:hypothetical protein